jgi:hypothetical protein
MRVEANKQRSSRSSDNYLEGGRERIAQKEGGRRLHKIQTEYEEREGSDSVLNRTFSYIVRM